MGEELGVVVVTGVGVALGTGAGVALETGFGVALATGAGVLVGAAVLLALTASHSVGVAAGFQPAPTYAVCVERAV